MVCWLDVARGAPALWGMCMRLGPGDMITASALPLARSPFSFAVTIDSAYNALFSPSVALVVVVTRLSDIPPLASPAPQSSITPDTLGSAAPSSSPNISLSFTTLFSFYSVQYVVLRWSEGTTATPRVLCPALGPNTTALTTLSTPGTVVPLGPGVSTVCYRTVNSAGKASATTSGLYVVAPTGSPIDVQPRGASWSGRPTDPSQAFLRAVVRVVLAHGVCCAALEWVGCMWSGVECV
jgi:hypothetical protein